MNTELNSQQLKIFLFFIIIFFGSFIIAGFLLFFLTFFTDIGILLSFFITAIIYMILLFSLVFGFAKKMKTKVEFGTGKKSGTFGFSSKKIDIKLSKKEFFPGEAVKGEIIFNAKKPICGKELNVALVGQKDIQTKGDGADNPWTWFRTEKYLDGEHEYIGKSYFFELMIPDDILEKSKNWIEQGQISENLKEIVMKFKDKRWFDKGDLWFVEVYLERPKKIALKNKVNIKINKKIN